MTSGPEGTDSRGVDYPPSSWWYARSGLSGPRSWSIYRNVLSSDTPAPTAGTTATYYSSNYSPPASTAATTTSYYSSNDAPPASRGGTSTSSYSSNDASPASTGMYLTNAYYEPGDGYRYPLYYSPATGTYYYYPVRR